MRHGQIPRGGRWAVDYVNYLTINLKPGVTKMAFRASFSPTNNIDAIFEEIAKVLDCVFAMVSFDKAC
jgi:hypothetical protein